MIILVPVLAAALGALVYWFVPGKASELGRLVFGCGALVFVYIMAQRGVRLW